MPELTDKQAAFVEEYLVDLNATQAAIRAGYSARTANAKAGELMLLPHIVAAIEEAKRERSERTRITADYVLRQAVKLHERCMQEVEPLTNRRGEPISDEEGRPVYVFNAAGAAKALELIGKHIDVQAFNERTETTINGEMTIRHKEDAERFASAISRLAARQSEG